MFFHMSDCQHAGLIVPVLHLESSSACSLFTAYFYCVDLMIHLLSLFLHVILINF